MFKHATNDSLELQIAYGLLMPALNPLTEDAYELQMNFVKSGGVGIALNMLTKNNFMSSADLYTRRLGKDASYSSLHVC